MCHSCMPRRVRVRCWGYLVAGKCILRSLVWLTMRFTPGSNACVVRPAEMQSPGAETLNHQPAQMHASPYARNLANARALESGLLWLMLTAICLRFLIYGLLPFTLPRDRAAAATLRPGSRIGAAVADLDATAGAPDQAHAAGDAGKAENPGVKLRASTELAAAEAGSGGLGARVDARAGPGCRRARSRQPCADQARRAAQCEGCGASGERPRAAPELVACWGQDQGGILGASPAPAEGCMHSWGGRTFLGGAAWAGPAPHAAGACAMAVGLLVWS